MIGVCLLAALLCVVNCQSCDETENETTLYTVCIEGCKDLYPVLLIHGLGTTMKTWDQVIEPLHEITGRTVCTVDLRNHGKSIWDDTLEVQTMTQDIVNTLNEKGIDRAIVVGHSVGGKIAMHFALNYPRRVKTLIVEDMRPNGITEEAFNSVKLYVILESEGIQQVPPCSTEDEAKEIVGAYMNENFTAMGIPPQDEQSINELPISCCDGEMCGYDYNIELFKKAMMEKNGNDLLGESRGVFYGPTLFIYGMDSPFKIEDDKYNILEMFPYAKFFGVKGVAHQVHRRKLFVFLYKVIEFIKMSKIRRRKNSEVQM